ncbi:MAG: hypothetical protein V1779_09710 [bacterium]
MYEEKMIDVKKAIEIAMNYFQSIYSDRLKSIHNILLEEIDRQEFNHHGDCWFITIGYDEIYEPTGTSADLYEPFGPRLRRKYKMVIIDKNGDVQALKIREVETA